MTKRTTEDNDDRLAEALAEIEALQSAAADAEARAGTARQQLTEAVSAREAVEVQVAELRAELEGAHSQVREAAVRYRAAQLAAQPEVPEELVPEAQTSRGSGPGPGSSIPRGGTGARAYFRRKQAGLGGARGSAGSPPRCEPDLSGLPASEKIRLGLQQLADSSNR